MGRYEALIAVAADIEYLVAPQIQAAVKGFGKHLIGGNHSVKGPGADGEGEEVIDVHTMR